MEHMNNMDILEVTEELMDNGIDTTRHSLITGIFLHKDFNAKGNVCYNFAGLYFGEKLLQVEDIIVDEYDEPFIIQTMRYSNVDDFEKIINEDFFDQALMFDIIDKAIQLNILQFNKPTVPIYYIEEIY